MLVQKFPKASQEKHLLRGFSICGGGTDDSRQSGSVAAGRGRPALHF
jgi:hypothetical protein